MRDCPTVRFVCVTVSPMSPAHNPHIRGTKKIYKFIHFTETLKNEIVYIILYCVQQKETETTQIAIWCINCHMTLIATLIATCHTLQIK